MRLKWISYLFLAGLLLQPLGLCAQDQPAEMPALDKAARLEVQGRLNKFLNDVNRISASCKAPLPMAGDVQLSKGYIRMQSYRLRTLDRNLKSLDVRWNNYYSLQQWEFSQDEGLMAIVERFTLTKQEASDSLDVRKLMLQSLRDFMDADAYMEGVDSTYNSLGKKAFRLSLTSKTAPMLEKLKKKEELLFTEVQGRFDKAREAGRYHLVSDKTMEELEDHYVSLKSKSETIQAMQYTPLIERIKDYLMGMAAVAVLLMFLSMLQSKIKSARQLKENMKKYKDTLKLNGQDDYPTI